MQSGRVSLAAPRGQQSRGASRGASRGVSVRMEGRGSPDLPPRPATSEASDAARFMQRRTASNGMQGTPTRARGGASPSLAPLPRSTGSLGEMDLDGPPFASSAAGGGAGETMMLEGVGDSEARARGSVRRARARAAAAGAPQPRSRRRRIGALERGTSLRGRGGSGLGGATDHLVERPVRRQLSFLGSGSVAGGVAAWRPGQTSLGR